MLACQSISEAGYWLDLRGICIDPNPEHVINQVQELYQKKYIEKPAYKVYEYDEGNKKWCCDCQSGIFDGEGFGETKVKAKKAAAMGMLQNIIESGKGYGME